MMRKTIRNLAFIIFNVFLISGCCRENLAPVKNITNYHMPKGYFKQSIKYAPVIDITKEEKINEFN